MARLYVLGSGAKSATPERQTSCYLLESRRSVVLVDAGTGLSRLLDPLFREMVARAGRVVLILSGFDHFRLAGLPGLPWLLPPCELTIAGPSADLESFLSSYFAEPCFPGGFAAWTALFANPPALHNLRAGVQRVAGERVDARISTGSLPRAGFRVRDAVFAGGLPASAIDPEWAREPSLLLMEAGPRDSGGEAAGHALAAEAVRFAAEVRARDLMLGGMEPSEDRASMDRLLFEVSGLFPRSILASDMMFFRLQGGAGEDEEEPPEGAAEECAQSAVEDEAPTP